MNRALVEGIPVRSLWMQPHREENYLAIRYARHFPDHITMSQLGLYRQMIVEGA